MANVTKKNINGMSWWVRTSLILLLTLASTGFMSGGWYKPSDVRAASNPRTYYLIGNTSTILGADGTANLPTAQSTTNATSTTTPTFRGLLSTSVGTATSWRPASTSTGTIVMLNGYGPVYANDIDISSITVTMAVRSNNTGYSWRMYLYDYDPAGAANNKTLIATSTSVSTTRTGTTQGLAPTYTIQGTGRIQAGHRLMAQIVHVATAASTAERIYYGGNTSTNGVIINVTETDVVADTTPPTAGTITITPDSGTYTAVAPTITTQFTDAESAVTSCQYTTNGADWAAGVVSGVASPYSCTANPTGLTGFLNINMRATSAGGQGTAVQIQRTVDTTQPTDGTLTVTRGDAQNSIFWSTATDNGGGSIETYILRYATGATAPANCAAGTAVTGSPFTSATLSVIHSGLTNNTQYSYRLCATDTLGNTSGGVTGSGTPTGIPPSTITSCNGCHGYTSSFGDGTDRNVPPSQFPGSHNKHVVVYSMQCSECHTVPVTESMADYKHANRKIDMAASIRNGSYQKTTGWPVTNTPTFSTCNNTQCHGATNPTWGAATATVNDCTICHAAVQGNRRQVTGTGGDISASYSSKHINSNTPDYNSCLACHEQSSHKTYSNGISVKLTGGVVYDGTAATAGALKGICITCHNGTGTPFAASGDTATPYNISATWPATGGAHDSKMICLNCHGNSGGVDGDTLNPKYNVHDSGTAHMLQDSGYDVLNPATYCLNCHNAASVDPNKSSKNISAQLALANKHTSATCFDCHGDKDNNVGSIHSLRAGSQAAGSGVIANNIARATGRSMTWSATNWGGASASANLASGAATAEYQICFKCHAAIGTGTTPDVPGAGTLAASFTNLALEFNPNNKSGHPIAVGLNNYPNSTAPKALTAAKMKAPWNVNLGTQVMTCSDCHATDSAASKGPHGSSVKWMLAGTNKAWPYTTTAGNGASTGTLFRLATYNTGNGTANGLFCLNCHTVTGSNNWHSNADITGGEHGGNAIVACASCHIRVPHGGKISRLLQATNAPARYMSNGNGAASSFDSWGSNATGAIKGSTMSSASFNSSCSRHNSASGETW
ncbi:MAG: hypothetical protein PHY09_05535 [Desulfuromonadaceae bacterium]|nr:hypothetical protein [Desulfuromonadaceae bacterium]MDD5107286.1 hypothetical protein [Desulfuromonadaceae bacterium]